MYYSNKEYWNQNTNYVVKTYTACVWVNARICVHSSFYEDLSLKSTGDVDIHDNISDLIHHKYAAICLMCKSFSAYDGYSVEYCAYITPQ